jgi:hypothetical protein
MPSTNKPHLTGDLVHLDEHEIEIVVKVLCAEGAFADHLVGRLAPKVQDLLNKRSHRIQRRENVCVCV